MRAAILVLLFLISISSIAQKNKLKDLEQQRKDALREIANTDKLLQDTKKTTSNLLSRINLISEQIESRKKVLSLLNQEIESIAVEQVNTEKEIEVLELELKDKQKSYAKAIEGMLTNRQSGNKLLYILSGKSLTETYRRFHYLKDYSEWRSKQANDIKDKSDELKKKKAALAKTKAAKIALIGLRTTEQGNLVTEETNYQTEMGEAKKKQKELQAILNEKKKQADALNRQIAKIIADEVARQDKETKRKAAEHKAAERKVTPPPASDNQENKVPQPQPEEEKSEDIVLSTNFASNKGRLPHPISGNATIIGRFGTHQHSEWNITTASNGIDMQSQAGASAKAVFNGEVSRVVALPGANYGIIVRHGNYYTFYGNIQTVMVKQGDKVSTGQTLGVVYTDPDVRNSQLHFQLWEGVHKQDPEPWLRP